ncbi:MAG: HAMP domain-containing sensor histidine kinase [Planctomycetota bacterium]
MNEQSASPTEFVHRGVSLQARVFLLVLLINLALFGAGSAFFLHVRADEAALRAEERVEDLLFARVPHVRDGDRLGVLLSWPDWVLVDDAILMDRHFTVDAVTGEVEPSMLVFNPLGRAHRDAGFDQQLAYRAIARAIAENQRVRAEDGTFAFPIQEKNGLWGGVWYRADVGIAKVDLFLGMLPWFLLSTLLLIGGTFWGLRRLVLDPVERLAAGARSVGAGRFGVQLTGADAGAPEITALVRSFNQMTGRVASFNATLQEEVRLASEKARQAEAALMTQRRLAAMGELAAGIAHEINNPLGGLTNAVQELRRMELPPERRERYLELLASGLARIGETVNRLQRFTPRTSPELERLDLALVAEDALELVAHRAASVGAELSLKRAGETVVTGARTELGQAILNLLTNSLDALEERGSGGRVELELARVGGVVTLTASDDGPGVTSEQLARVSDLFFTTKEVGKGTGLGLALVHGVIEAHGGTVTIESVLGSYFRVTFALPAASEGAS